MEPGEQRPEVRAQVHWASHLIGDGGSAEVEVEHLDLGQEADVGLDGPERQVVELQRICLPALVGPLGREAHGRELFELYQHQTKAAEVGRRIIAPVSGVAPRPYALDHYVDSALALPEHGAGPVHDFGLARHKSADDSRGVLDPGEEGWEGEAIPASGDG